VLAIQSIRIRANKTRSRAPPRVSLCDPGTAAAGEHGAGEPTGGEQRMRSIPSRRRVRIRSDPCWMVARLRAEEFGGGMKLSYRVSMVGIGRQQQAAAGLGW
jgi:hypothetical protein